MVQSGHTNWARLYGPESTDKAGLDSTVQSQHKLGSTYSPLKSKERKKNIEKKAEIKKNKLFTPLIKKKKMKVRVEERIHVSTCSQQAGDEPEFTRYVVCSICSH